MSYSLLYGMHLWEKRQNHLTLSLYVFIYLKFPPFYSSEKKVTTIETKPVSITLACTNIYPTMLLTYYGKFSNQKIQEKEETQTFSLLSFPQ